MNDKRTLAELLKDSAIILLYREGRIDEEKVMEYREQRGFISIDEFVTATANSLEKVISHV